MLLFDLVDGLFYFSILLFSNLPLRQRSDFFHALELLVEEVFNVFCFLFELVLLVSSNLSKITSFFIRSILYIIVVIINYSDWLFFLE